MAEIKRLSSHMADLIAAGEVVDRPMSVVKELLENSIDAGAKNITVEIENGGISYIRVTDDGKGMDQDDAKQCFLRHATSKIYYENDLECIKTLGFRGEALAAIAAVSKIDLFTKRKKDSFGTLVNVIAGEVQTVSETGSPDGTTMIVRDLFYNTPARMKFLKKDFTEASYITDVIINIALSNPNISLKYIKDGKTIIKTSGNGDLKSVIYNTLGKDESKEIIEIRPYEIDGIRVFGYISKPHASKKTRNMQHFFVNGRTVKSKLLSTAVEQAYKNQTMVGKFPYFVLNVSLSERKVDVNVHPTKTEVKFEGEKKVFDAVYMGCKNALETTNIVVKPEIRETSAVFVQEEIVVSREIPSPVEVLSNTENYYQKQELEIPKTTIIRPVETNEQAVEYSEPIYKAYEKPKEEKPQQNDNINTIAKPLKVIGECFNTYILCEYDNEMIMIDKHAAHERVLFNKLMENSKIFESQVLLKPEIVSIPSKEYGEFVEKLDEINDLGFDIEIFSNNSVVVRQVPTILEQKDIEDCILAISSRLVYNKNIEIEHIHHLLHDISCKSAIKGNQYTSFKEMESLAHEVFFNEKTNYCPHGRPLKVSLSKNQLEKMFKRKL